MTPLRNSWMKIYVPLVEHMKLQVRMNVKAKAVELRNSKHTEETGAVQKGADFIKAFALGFDVDVGYSGHDHFLVRRPNTRDRSLSFARLGRNCSAPSRRPLRRHLRDQGRQNPPRRQPFSCNRSYCGQRWKDSLCH